MTPIKTKKALKAILFLLFLSINIPINCIAQPSGKDITGLWYNEEKTAKINIHIENNEFFGTITWVKLEQGDSGLDNKNPDVALQTKPLVGLTLLKNFKYDDGDYEGGTIYDPKNGKTYSCIMKLESTDKLYVRGFVGFSLIGRTTYWSRIE